MSRRVMIAVVLAAVLAALGAAWFSFAPRLFGLSAGYAARDGDAVLTPLARTALPVIAALERFRSERGAYPSSESPADVAYLTSILPQPITARSLGNFMAIDVGLTARQWLYYRARAGQASYTLSLKLGWDPQLIYRRDDTAPHWVFDPGDGSDDRVVDLKP